VLRARAQTLSGRIAQARRGRALVETSLGWFTRERALAASVLAGGIAYRLFFWLLPAALVVSGVFGFSSSETVEDLGQHAGLTATAANAVAQAVQDHGTGRWALLLIGAGGLLWTSSWSVVAFQRVFALIWHVPPPRASNPLGHALGFSAVLIMLLSIPLATAWLRSVSTISGAAAAIAALGAYFAIWLQVSRVLPHGDAPSRALVPGALLMALGLEVMHVVTVFYLAAKLDRASALYGGLGVAATFLFVLWLAGRLVISSTILNVELWCRNKPDAARITRVNVDEGDVRALDPA
jgi:uncharacterized BrkB/YihY/UPF0761 family membrane protein